MRIIGTIPDEDKYNPLLFSHFLQSKGIEHSIEETRSSIGKKNSFQVWVVEEEEIPTASNLLDEYLKDPQNKRYLKALPSPTNDESPQVKRRFPSRSFAPLTFTILVVVVFLFIWALMGRGNLIPPPLKGIAVAPMLAPIERTLVYDYPHYFTLRDKLLTLWTEEDIKEKKEPSQEAAALLQEIHNTPVWMGIYERILLHYKDPTSPLLTKAPLFEKIREGQYWRTITPIFLHLDLLHIFFNVLWFIILGNQIENRIGSFRYIILIVLTALVSNSAQYLVSGPFFMGLSGVICGMAAFVWARQQKAPWEGYLIHRLTLIFLGIFVVGMFALSTIFFFLQLIKGIEISIGIANTAHLTGALVGYLLGRSSLFASHL